MANDRNRMDEYAGPEGGRPGDQSEERVRQTGIGEEVRGVAEEGEEDFEEMDDLEDDEESSF